MGHSRLPSAPCRAHFKPDRDTNSVTTRVGHSACTYLVHSIHAATRISVVTLPLDTTFPPDHRPVLRRIWTSASVTPYGPLNYLLPKVQPRRPFLPPTSSEFTPKIGYNNSHMNSNTGNYSLSRLIDHALSQRLPLHTEKHRQLPYRYRYGTCTNTYRCTRPYRTLQYVRYRYLLEAHLGHNLGDTLVHMRNEATSQSVGGRCSSTPHSRHTNGHNT